MSGRDLEGGVSSEPNPRVAGGGGYPNISATYSATVTLAKQWTPWVVPMFVAANVVMFVITMFVNNCPKNNDHLQGSCVLKFLGRLSFEPLGVNSFLGPSSFTLGKMGALEWYNVVHGRQGWRLITCIWLHAGVAHLLANMLILDLLGIRLERQFGFARVGLIYILSGFGGSVLSSLFNRTIISVGASGALFGLLGAMLSDLISNWTIYTYKGAAIIELLLNFVMNLALGILPHVDNFAHIGGFLTGFLLGFVLLVRPQFGWVECRYRSADAHVKSKYKPYQYILWLIAVILLIVGLSMGLVMLFRGVNGNDRCSWCHYLSCVPTSKWKCDN